MFAVYHYQIAPKSNDQQINLHQFPNMVLNINLEMIT